MSQASGLLEYLQAILVISNIDKAKPAQHVLDTVVMMNLHRLQRNRGQ